MSLRLTPARVILGFILLLGLTLRLWGLGFGLPNLSRPDEQNISSMVVKNMLIPFFEGHGQWNPGFFEYPSLYLYLIAFLYDSYFLLGHLLGIFPTWQEFIHLYFDDWSSFHLISRVLTVCFASITLWATYHLGKVLGNSKAVGLISAFLLSVCYLHVRDSHFGVTDVPVGLWISLSLWLAVKAVQGSSDKTARKAIQWAALFAGLAAGTKYPGGITLLSALLAYSLRWPQQLPIHLKNPLLWQIILLCTGSFLFTSPYILLDFHQFWHDFNQQVDHMRYGHIIDVGVGWLYHARFSLWIGLGGLFFSLAIASILYHLLLIWLNRRQNAVFSVPLLFTILFYVLIGNTHTVFIRYVMPLIPVLSVFTALGIHRIAHALTKKPMLNAALLILLSITISAESLSQSIRFDQLLCKTDTRSLARNWFLTHLTPGESVGIGVMLTHVDLPSHFRKVELKIPEGDAFLGQPKRNFINTTKLESNLIPNDRNEVSISTYRNPKALHQLGIRYLTIAYTPLTLLSPPDFERDPIAKNYRLLAHFRNEPPDHPTPKEAYDQLDAFYLPYQDLSHVERPGPEIWIYEVPSATRF